MECTLILRNSAIETEFFLQNSVSLSDIDGHFIELGTRRGGSASIIASGIRDSGTQVKPLVTVCRYTSEASAEDYKVAREIYIENGFASEYICSVMFESIAFLELWQILCRAIFVDTSHDYNQTLTEIKLGMQILMEGGWLILHDYCPDFGVVPALNHFLDTQTDYEVDVYWRERLACVKLIERRRSPPIKDSF